MLKSRIFLATSAVFFIVSFIVVGLLCLAPRYASDIIFYLGVFFTSFGGIGLTITCASKLNVVSTSITSRSFLVDLLLPVTVAKDIQANLEEALPLWIAAHGPGRAKWIKRSQEIQLIVGHWFTPFKLAFDTVVKLIK